MRDERVGSAQRTEVIAVLGRALDEGALALDDYDGRVVAVGTATYTSDLQAQLRDLPPEYGWRPHPIAPAPALPAASTPRSGRAALILGIASLPLSICFVGGILGIIAVVLSMRGDRRRGGLSAALLGRALGIVGIMLSAGATIAILFAAHKH
ncbi:MAG TPA: DUF1707 domain-containing protein [Actinoplanes sp.]|nr:DUF1707 domain-containing protein [Actinoplanes sp.]